MSCSFFGTGKHIKVGNCGSLADKTEMRDLWWLFCERRHFKAERHTGGWIWKMCAVSRLQLLVTGAAIAIDKMRLQSHFWVRVKMWWHWQHSSPTCQAKNDDLQEEGVSVPLEGSTGPDLDDGGVLLLLLLVMPCVLYVQVNQGTFNQALLSDLT